MATIMANDGLWAILMSATFTGIYGAVTLTYFIGRIRYFRLRDRRLTMR